MIADRRLYLNAAKDTVVEEHDPAAAFLLAAAGSEIPREYHELVTGTPAPTDDEPLTITIGNVAEEPAAEEPAAEEPAAEEPAAEEPAAEAAEKPERRSRSKG